MIGVNYRGSELSEVDCDRIALDRVSPKLLTREVELCNTAWFDYRMMHPTQRTYLFAHYYDQAFRYMIALHVDREQVMGDNPRSYFPKGADPLGKTKAQELKDAKSGKNSGYKMMTMIWKARQKADELGIPYDIFCMSGMKAAIGRIWQRIPSPAQLYSDNIINSIIDRWAELLSERLFVASDAFYQIKQWVNHSAQLDHAKWICEQAMLRARPEMTIMQYAYKTPMIPSQTLSALIPPAVIIEAHRLSKQLL